MGLRLSEEKTLITHIDEGLDFLGWRIQRHRKRGTSRHYVYIYPAKKALRPSRPRCKTLCRQNIEPAAGSPAAPAQPGAAGLDRLLPPRRVQPRPSATCAPSSLAPGLRMAAAQAPPDELEGTPPPLLRRRMVARRRRGDAVQPGEGAHHPLPLPGNDDPLALAQHELRTTPARRGLWRAGCGDNGHVRFGRAAWTLPVGAHLIPQGR